MAHAASSPERETASAFRKAALLPELLAEHLREQIAAGTLAPGRRLVEQELAGQLQVSRVPLREAFRILCAEGLVTLSPHRGAEVSAVSQEELEELFEVRAMIEARAAALAARRAGPSQQQELSTLVEEMAVAAGSGDTVAYYRKAALFHDLVVAAAGNTSLTRIHAQLKTRLRRYQMALSALPELPARSNREHTQILSAIRAGDPHKAALVAEEHVEALVSRYRQAQARRNPPTPITHR